MLITTEKTPDPHVVTYSELIDLLYDSMEQITDGDVWEATEMLIGKLELCMNDAKKR